MSSISTPPSDYKILIPKTFFTGTPLNLTIDLAGQPIKKVKLIMGLRFNAAVSSSGLAFVRPFKASAMNANIIVKNENGQVTPVDVNGQSAGNVNISQLCVAGTDAGANDLGYNELNFNGWDESALPHWGDGHSHILIQGIPLTRVLTFSWFDLITSANDGFFISSAANFDNKSWYEVIRLE
jgi:hypothetical protein